MGKIAVGFGVLALLVTAGWSSRGYFWAQPGGVKYRMLVLGKGAIDAYVSATGTLNPVIMVQVGTQVSGTIEKLFADYNSAVQDGQIIAQLDQASFRAKVAQADASLENARADLKNAQANVINVGRRSKMPVPRWSTNVPMSNGYRWRCTDAKRDLERHRTLCARQLTSRSELDTVQSAYDSAVAQRNSARAQLHAAEARVRSRRRNCAALTPRSIKLRHRSAKPRPHWNRRKSTSTAPSFAPPSMVRSFRATWTSARRWQRACRRRPYSRSLRI